MTNDQYINRLDELARLAAAAEDRIQIERETLDELRRLAKLECNIDNVTFNALVKEHLLP